METPPSVGRYISQNSKKIVFPGGSSTSESSKQKELIRCEVIDVDMDNDVILIDDNTESIGKGKLIRHEVMDVDMEEHHSDVILIDDNIESKGKGKEVWLDLTLGQGGSANGKPIDEVEFSKKLCPADDLDLLYNAGIYDNTSFDDSLFDVTYFEGVDHNEESILQSHFDNMDVPPGVEVQIPWMSVGTGGAKTGSNMTSSSTSKAPSFPLVSSSPGPTLYENNFSAIGNSNPISFKDQSGSINPSPNIQVSHVKFHSWHTQLIPGGVSYLPPPMPGWTNLPLPTVTQGQASSAFQLALGDTDSALMNFSTPQFFPGVGPASAMHYMNHAPSSWVQDPHNSVTTTGEPLAVEQKPPKNLGESLKNFRHFKKFDTVDDHSDHYFSQQQSLDIQASKGCAKRIQEEWKILEKDLPGTIFVRVYESRMDLLRAVIIGAEGTPYHDGLFFFDVYFPSNYPNVPPLVHYHSFGLRINPNLYNSGKVCLSLLNTWSGQGKEMWIPGQSTMLQVLVSIQGLILNEEPFFNEPGYARNKGSPLGDQSSLQYNETTYIDNLKTMVYCMRRPPQHFEDFVVGYYFQSCRDILAACKSYLDGAQVGTLVRGCVVDTDKANNKRCSPGFKKEVQGFMQTLVDTFTKIGAKDCDKFAELTLNASTTG